MVQVVQAVQEDLVVQMDLRVQAVIQENPVNQAPAALVDQV